MDRLVRVFGLGWEAPKDCYSLLRKFGPERGADKRANTLWNCAVLASLLVVCSERYRTIIDDKEEVSSICGKIKFMFHWVSMSRHF